MLAARKRRLASGRSASILTKSEQRNYLAIYVWQFPAELSKMVKNVMRSDTSRKSLSGITVLVLWFIALGELLLFSLFDILN